MDTHDTYGIEEQLREVYERNSPPFDEAAFSDRLRRKTITSRKRVSAPRRTSGLRIAAVAFAALVILTAVGVGVFELATYLGNLGEGSPTVVSEPGIVIGDQTTETAAPGQTTQTTPGELPSGTWMRLPLLAEGGPVGTLVMDPSDPAILYVATAEGLFKSTDGAGSWSRLPTIPGIEPGGMWLLLDPNSPSTIYTIAYANFAEADTKWTTCLLRSDDGGLTWMDLNEAGAPRIGSTSSGPWLDTTTIPSTLYMYDDTGYVCRSTDRGTTWTRLSVDEGQRAAALADQSVPIPAAAQQALDDFLAPFSGDWVYLTDADTGAVVGPSGAILVDPDHTSTFYAATSDGVYKSTDSGRTWRKASRDLMDPAVSSVLVDPNTPSTLYATTNAGIFRSTDGGTEWTLILGGGTSVVLAPSNPNRLYARTSAGLFRSDDGGTNWTRLNDPTGYRGPWDRLVLVIADQPDTLFAIAEEVHWGPGYLYRSTDAGESWQRTGLEAFLDPSGGPLVVADPEHPSTIYAWGRKDDSYYHMFRSTDAGATWTETDLDPRWDVPDRNTVVVVSLAVDPYNPETIWAIQDNLSDNGRSVIHRSTDGGATWENVEFDGLEQWTSWLVADQRSSGVLYALSGSKDPWGGDVYRSTDAGATWEDIGGNIPTELMPVVVPDPAPGGALYAATGGGLFKWVPREPSVSEGRRLTPMPDRRKAYPSPPWSWIPATRRSSTQGRKRAFSSRLMGQRAGTSSQRLPAGGSLSISILRRLPQSTRSTGHPTSTHNPSDCSGRTTAASRGWT